MYSHLLAKRTDNPEDPNFEQTIIGHTHLVLEALDVINTVTREYVLKLMDEDITSEYWEMATFCAAWLHDIGKANDHFQKMMRRPDFRQGVRHDTLGLVVITDLLEDWMEDFWKRFPSWLKAAVLFAVGGHHLKFPDQKERVHTEVMFLGGHPNLIEFLEIGQKRLSLESPPQLFNRSYSLLSLNGIKKSLSQLRRQFDLDFSSSQKLFIAALKSTLMAADIAGSALPASGQDVQAWLKKRIQSVLDVNDLETVVQKKIMGQTLHPFQKKVKDANESTLLIEAGCGSGKTAAAYLWAAQKAQGKRLFFCYPTTTTASEGFSGYFQEPDFEAILIHSRAAVDYRLLENMPSPTKAELELRSLKLEALDTWPVPVVVCTAHTVLGLLQNERRGIFAWASLIRSVIVFDEIHSFSPKLFQHLLKFLEIFHSIPILLMSATIPPERKEALEKSCRKRGGLRVISGPEVREKAERYILKRAEETEAWDSAFEILGKGGKVLWICNTVARCMSISKKAWEDGLPIQPFHSRYRYMDRLNRQRAVIDGFLPNKPSTLAVTTQVAEMSLDLSADLLITEYAPLSALIQRLGRLNRFQDEPPTACLSLLIKPENAMPYEKKEKEREFWEKIENWLDKVADGEPKSQEELSMAFWEVEKIVDQLQTEELFCDWIDDPWSALTGRHALMEPGYTIEVVREEDIERGHPSEMVIPMPFPKDKSWVRWPHRGHYLIAPEGAINYDPFWGGEYAQGKSNYSII